MLPNLQGWPVGVVASKAKFAKAQMRLYPKAEANTEVHAPFCDINASRYDLEATKEPIRGLDHPKVLGLYLGD